MKTPPSLKPAAHMPTEALAILNQSTCHRCGGFMVLEDYMDLLDDTGAIGFRAKKCVQCGEVIDPVICLNRYRRPEALTRQLHQHITAVALSADTAA